MFYSGIADECGRSLQRQIETHHALGWNHIELRFVDGCQCTDLSEEAFLAAFDQLQSAGMQVSCLASAIACGGRKITDDLCRDTEALARAIPRMHALNTPFLRIMSYVNNGLSEKDWGDEAVRRVQSLCAMASDGGVTLLLENCSGWASLSPTHFTRFFERVDRPALQAVYDTGNPAAHLQDNTWEWYLAAKPFLAYVHVKSHTGPLPDPAAQRMTFPDEGSSRVAETLRDLVKNGYDGGISIEPHLAKRVHTGLPKAEEDRANAMYREYGRRLMRLVENERPHDQPHL